MNETGHLLAGSAALLTMPGIVRAQTTKSTKRSVTLVWVEISESDRFSRVFLAKKLARFSIDQMYLGASFARHCLVLRVRDIVFFIIVQRVLNV